MKTEERYTVFFFTFFIQERNWILISRFHEIPLKGNKSKFRKKIPLKGKSKFKNGAPDYPLSFTGVANRDEVCTGAWFKIQLTSASRLHP